MFFLGGGLPLGVCFQKGYASKGGFASKGGVWLQGGKHWVLVRAVVVTVADGTHPTGIHSCLRIMHSDLVTSNLLSNRCFIKIYKYAACVKNVYLIIVCDNIVFNY